jgi:hypothetical protein
MKPKRKWDAPWPRTHAPVYHGPVTVTFAATSRAARLTEAKQWCRDQGMRFIHRPVDTGEVEETVLVFYGAPYHFRCPVIREEFSFTEISHAVMFRMAWS